jgi:uncharacterized repeat protein (TIGR04076 family)
MKERPKKITPDEQKLLDERKLALKKLIGITDKDFKKYISFTHNRKLSLRRAEINKYQIIAEVVKAKYCTAGMKVGQKYIFSAIPNKLLLDQSTCPLCIKALGPLSDVMQVLWDRLIEGVDPNEGTKRYVSCPDQGVDYGGLGTVVFKVYAQKTT